VATSDDPGASQAIAEFATSTLPWLVAVRMVSEGVDIPRLRVGVFATTTTTELFFRQAVGRFVRWRPGIGRQAAYLFIPDDPRLRSGAAQIAEARRHSLSRREGPDRPAGPGDDRDGEEPGRTDAEEQLSLFTVISAVATEAVDADGQGVDEPREPDDDPSLLLDLGALPPAGGHAGPSLAGQAYPSGAAAGAGHAAHGSSRLEHRARLRAANTAVARTLAREAGWSHAKVNAELNRLAGLERVTEATLSQLESRLRHGERWLSRVQLGRPRRTR
jgi:hypothetical protein